MYDKRDALRKKKSSNNVFSRVLDQARYFYKLTCKPINKNLIFFYQALIHH